MHRELANPELQARQPRYRKGVDPFAQRYPRDRQSIDRIGLPALANRLTRVRHQPSRKPNDRLTAIEQESLEPTADVSAVLDHPDPLPV